MTAARLASRSHGTCTGDYGGRHRRVRPPPRGLSTTTTTTYLLLLGLPALRLHPWREGGIGVAPAILLWFISGIGILILIALFLEVGIARLFEELPVNRHLGSLESALAVEHRSRHEHYLHFYRIRPLMKECGFL